jgi:hypothetical protein
VRLTDDSLDALAGVLVERLRRPPPPSRALRDVTWQLARIAERRNYRRLVAELESALRPSEQGENADENPPEKRDGEP